MLRFRLSRTVSRKYNASQQAGRGDFHPMANKKSSTIGKERKKQESFADLLEKAPKLKSFQRATVAGILFQSDQDGKFVIQTPDGVFYELNVQAVAQHRILDQRGEYTIVEVEVPACELSENAPSSPLLSGGGRAIIAATGPPAPSGQVFYHSDPTTAHNQVDAVANDSTHPIRKYWRFESEGPSPFQQFGDPFSKTAVSSGKRTDDAN
jgi:hypothetical protein